MSSSTVERKISEVWKSVAKKADIPKRISRTFVSSNSELPKIYHLVKTHKKGADIKVRPIVACRDGPSMKIAWLLSRLLRSLLNSVPAHLESSRQLIKEIEDIDGSKFFY